MAKRRATTNKKYPNFDAKKRPISIDIPGMLFYSKLTHLLKQAANYKKLFQN